MADYSDRAKRVMQLANQDAQRLNHEYIGTEHILLGLVKEGGGVAARVLGELGVDLRKIRLEVEKLVQSGPDVVTMGRLTLTPRAKKVLEYAEQEAGALNHPQVESEDILLGLLREPEGVGSQVLTQLGLMFDRVREVVVGISRGFREAPERKPWGRIRILGLYEESEGRWVPSDCCFVVERDGTLRVDTSYRG